MSGDSEYPRGWGKAERDAARLADDPEAAGRKADDAARKAEKNRGALAKVWHDLQTMIRLVRAWKSGEYPDVPTRTILMVLGALAYFISPIDAIPDFLFPLGYTDDVAVIGLVVASVAKDIERFQEWERSRRRA